MADLNLNTIDAYVSHTLPLVFGSDIGSFKPTGRMGLIGNRLISVGKSIHFEVIVDYNLGDEDEHRRIPVVLKRGGKKGYFFYLADRIAVEGLMPKTFVFFNPKNSVIQLVSAEQFGRTVARTLGAKYSQSKHSTHLPNNFVELIKKTELVYEFNKSTDTETVYVPSSMFEDDVATRPIVIEDYDHVSFDEFSKKLEEEDKQAEVSLVEAAKVVAQELSRPDPEAFKVVDDGGEVKHVWIEEDSPEKPEDNGEFVHLHVHSQYSFLDGVPSPEAIAQHVHDIGQPAFALTDHGYMFGCYKQQQACKDVGVKPIHGFEAYYVDDASSRENRGNYHLVLLAQTEKGWQNLVKLCSIAGRDGFYYRPRIDKKMLADHSEGVIVLSGCYKSPVSYHFSEEARDIDKARANMQMLKGMFGDRFYNEVMHIDWPLYDDLVPEILNMAEDEGVKSVMTNDCHYLKQEDHAIQNTLLKVATGNSGGLEFSSSDFFFKNRGQMITGSLTAEMADATLEITDRVDFALDFQGYKFPSFDITQSSDYDKFIGWKNDQKKIQK